MSSRLPSSASRARFEAQRDWRGNPRPAAPTCGLPALLRQALAAHAQAPALCWKGRHLSYAELGHAADALGREIDRLVEPGALRVALLAKRGPSFLAAVHSLGLSGRCMLTLDPDLPEARLAAQLEEAQPALLLHCAPSAGLAARLAPGLTRVALGNPFEAAPGAASAAPVVEANAPAYLQFTSGSTGRPKAALVSQRALCNRMLWLQALCPIGPGDRMLLKTPPSFDVVYSEALWPLLNGACVVIAEPEEHRDPALLARRMAEHSISHIDLVPSVLTHLLEEPALSACGTLRWVFSGGEALAPALVRRLSERLPGVRIANLYGPSETCIDVSFHACSEDDPEDFVPLGGPAFGTRFYVVDDAGELLDVDTPGELWIAGAAVGLGYLDRPELSAAAFGEDPFVPGERIYRSGDRVCWQADGSLRFLGRIDHQIKLRGLRIEPEEVEHALLQLPEVRAAGVCVRGEGGSARLVAFVVAEQPGTALPERLLREQLRTRLPESLLPQQFVAVEALPCLPSGKLDRRALAALPLPPSAARVALSAAAISEPASSDLGARYRSLLHRLWEQQLGYGEIDGDTNYFDAGGDSLGAVAMLRALEKECGWRLNIMSVAQGSLASLADELAQLGPPLLGSAMAAGDTDSAPASQDTEGLWPRLRRWLGGSDPT
ncbi:MAG: non-ribosomal peptide synthetase [Aquimonas sp.]|nr:non-ribosomal peptide synthetase [Aquimonas sp.]